VAHSTVSDFTCYTQLNPFERECSFTCDTGYGLLNGIGSYYCQKNEQWTPAVNSISCESKLSNTCFRSKQLFGHLLSFFAAYLLFLQKRKQHYEGL